MFVAEQQASRWLFLFVVRFLFLKAEVNRHSVFDTYGFSFLHAGTPFRHCFDDANRLFVKRRIPTRLGNLNIRNRAVFIHHKLHNHLALDIVLIGDLRVFHVASARLRYRRDRRPSPLQERVAQKRVVRERERATGEVEPSLWEQV